MKTPAAAPPSGTTAVHAFRGDLGRVCRRARAVALGGAVIAALAADVWYEVGSFWAFRLFKVWIWNPPFFFVALVVFAAQAVRRTGTLALSRSLDAEFALKERLVSAFRFAQLAGLPADIREAQARETLRAVDFRRLRASFRFRPWGQLVLLAAGCGVTAVLMYRYPGVFNPRSVAFRQSRVVFQVVKDLATGPREGAESPGAGDGQQGGGDHPLVALVPESKSPKQGAPTESPSGGGTDEKSPPGRNEPSPPAPSEESSTRHPGNKPGEKPPPGAGPGSHPGPDEGGALGRSASLEETEGISPPTPRPESGLATAVADLRVPGSGPALPPLPFVRLFGGGTQAGTLLDPESLNIVLESYPPKYREQLASYFKALQDLRASRKGS